MKHSADMTAVANKKSAMSGEDITQFAKYAMGFITEPTSRLRSLQVPTDAPRISTY